MFETFALPYYIQLPTGSGVSSTQTGTVPVFHSSVDCPANVWSAIRSCPNLAGWILLVGLGGFLAGLYLARQ